mmetsp:Transcript_93250/g.260519  ORF Transcript_93250/g.260519 Transcript_93250/m.260519 type:complete len:208 (-) Transcript_93250:13-636(-)
MLLQPPWDHVAAEATTRYVDAEDLVIACVRNVEPASRAVHLQVPWHLARHVREIDIAEAPDVGSGMVIATSAMILSKVIHQETSMNLSYRIAPIRRVEDIVVFAAVRDPTAERRLVQHVHVRAVSVGNPLPISVLVDIRVTAGVPKSGTHEGVATSGQPVIVVVVVLARGEGKCLRASAERNGAHAGHVVVGQVVFLVRVVRNHAIV